MKRRETLPSEHMLREEQRRRHKRGEEKINISEEKTVEDKRREAKIRAEKRSEEKGKEAKIRRRWGGRQEMIKRRERGR